MNATEKLMQGDAVVKIGSKIQFKDEGLRGICSIYEILDYNGRDWTIDGVGDQSFGGLELRDAELFDSFELIGQPKVLDILKYYEMKLVS